MPGMKIIGPATALRTTVEANLPTLATTLFREQMLPELWDAAVLYGIDPVGMVAQSGKETAWGLYPGKVKPWFYNTAGIKVRHVDNVRAILAADLKVDIKEISGDHPLVHQQFPNWRVGAVAHAQRLCDYCLITIPGLIVDPRHGFGNRGITTWAELGTRWAPSATYGQEIEVMMQRLAGV